MKEQLKFATTYYVLHLGPHFVFKTARGFQGKVKVKVK